MIHIDIYTERERAKERERVREKEKECGINVII